jgi:hypothetical protein
MGVLPLQYPAGQTAQSLGLAGDEVFDVAVDDGVRPLQELQVTAANPRTGVRKTFAALCRIDTPVEIDYYRNGGILQTVLRKLLLEPAAREPQREARGKRRKPRSASKGKARARRPARKTKAAPAARGKARPRPRARRGTSKR